MPPNDIHNSTLLTTLTFNDFNLDNNIDTSKCRITLLLIVLIIISPFISVSINLCIVFCFFLFCFLFRFSVVFFFVYDVVLSFKVTVTTSPPGTRFLFDWNPCTKFNLGTGCENALVSIGNKRNNMNNALNFMPASARKISFGHEILQ